MIKLMTLNLWRYHEWDKRIGNIIDLINKDQPECILLQEVLTNHAFSDFPASDLIAEKCGYEYRVFAPTLSRNDSKDKNGNRSQHVSEGLSVISKHPIASSESYYLKMYPEYPEEKSVLFCLLSTPGGLINICNVHFANSNVAYKHLDELLRLIDIRKVATVISGDFNIYKLADHKAEQVLLQKYILSSEKRHYISYPPDDDTLDYVAVPSASHELSNVVCHENFVSDHRAVSAVIQPRLKSYSTNMNPRVV